MSRSNPVVSSPSSIRIAEARNKKGMRQADLAVAVSEKLHRQTPYTVPTVSAWETGRKGPTASTLVAIAEVLDVSVAYLLGQTNNPHGEADPDEPESGERDSATEIAGIRKYSSETITRKEYNLYVKKPVFVTFTNGEYADQWAILVDEDHLTLTDGTRVELALHPCNLYPLEIYDFPRYHKRFDKAVGAAQFSELNVFWVEMITNSDEIRERYNGWYIHSSDGNTIINTSNSNILLASGFGISYKVYINPFDGSEKKNIYNESTATREARAEKRGY